MHPAPRSALLASGIAALLSLAAHDVTAQSAPAAACGGGASAASSGPPAAALATFDTAWTVIHTRHFDTTFNGVDWQAVRTELRPRAAGAKSVDELRAVLRDMIGRLGQSHFSIIPTEASNADPDAGDDGDVGIKSRWVDGQAIVFDVAPGSSAARAGLAPGWTIVAVDGCDVGALTRAVHTSMAPRAARFRASRMVDGRLRGAIGSSARVVMIDGAGARRELVLAREAPRGDVVQLMGLPPMRVSARSRRVEANGVSAGYIGFDGWFPTLSARIDSAIAAHRAAGNLHGMIIDLRGNGGGVGGMVMGLSGHFLSTVDTLGTMKMRGQELNFVSNPRTVTAAGTRVEPLAVPLAILVDEASASTSEIFAGAMQALGRARVFGDTTAGAALPAVTKKLPNEDVLYHAIADFTIPGGIRLEGRGVIPDEVAPLTRSDLLAGRDPALDAAMRWIASRPRP